MAAWGGAGFRVHRLGAGGGTGALTVGVFSLPGPAPRGSVRVYGRRRDGGVALLAAITHDGTPGAPSLAGRRATARRSSWRRWLGRGVGTRWAGSRDRAVAPAGAATAWSDGGARPALFPDGLQALGFAVKRRRGHHPLRGAATRVGSRAARGRPSRSISIVPDGGATTLVLVRRQRRERLAPRAAGRGRARAPRARRRRRGDASPRWCPTGRSRRGCRAR